MIEKRRKKKSIEQLKKENLDLKELLNRVDERVKHIKHIETLTFDQIKKIKPKLMSVEKELDFELEEDDEESQEDDADQEDEEKKEEE